MIHHLLALESSCDETAVAVLRSDSDGVRVLAENVWSQIAMHQPYQGVVPEVAARAHLEYFPDLIRKTLDDATLEPDSIDCCAATTGPGLIGGLLTGTMIARTIAEARSIPFYGINHLEAHLLSPRLPGLDGPKPDFPYLVLLASGGHTLLVRVDGVGRYHTLGRSRDDALGEAFDKSSVAMGLGYPGGPVVERYARPGDPDRFRLPAPLVDARDKQDRLSADFSFSGLKTAVARLAATFADQDSPDSDRADLCAAFQQAVARVLENRLTNALALCGDQTLTGVAFVGGVAANQFLRHQLERLCQKFDLPLATVPLRLCTDNATMIGWAAMERIQAGLASHPEHQRVRPRWPLEALAS